jgi:Zn-dependent metalloprotease
VPGRAHERFEQLYHGVPVWGAELVRQSDDRAGTVSLFGRLYEDLALDVTPRVAPAAARALAEARLAGGRTLQGPELVVLAEPSAAPRLAWRVRVLGTDGLRVLFVDAHSGALALEYSDLQTQAAVGLGHGVYGDDKKISTRADSGGFVADDQLRPPAIVTLDLKGDLTRALRLVGTRAPEPSDVARDADNEWTDGAAVDAHVYAGWTYDYLYRRFGRAGLDDRDLPVLSLVHIVDRADYPHYAATDPQAAKLFFANAFYAGNGVMVYGEGLPEGVRLSTGQAVENLAAALDVVAHELAHGVTDFTSRLIYRGESGALNEAFSDIVATGAEFYFQPPGDGPLRADYLLGEDAFVPGGVRSMADPEAYGDPDHYSRRYLGPEDSGGVHINSAIANHAFYLAVEGGRNRSSGLVVGGVGAANREQIERVFYRAFTLLLPRSADFALAREATLQSARDLYGAGSPAEQAVAEAWAAVGVE